MLAVNIFICNINVFHDVCSVKNFFTNTIISYAKHLFNIFFHCLTFLFFRITRLFLSIRSC